MPQTVRPILEALFAGSGPAAGGEVFSWRLVHRKGQPFMLLQDDLQAARTGLILYSAQRWPARLWRALLPCLLRTTSVIFFERLRFQASAESEIIRFIAQQSGVSGNIHSLSAIKFSEVRERLRLVLLLCDESGRPARILKVGLNAAGQQATNQEADFLEMLPSHTIGCIHMTGRVNRPSLTAFATDYFPGECPRNDAGMENLFHAWLNPGPPVPLDRLPAWQELDAAATRADSNHWQVVKKALAGKPVHTTLYHGDFAPWNVRVVSSQNLRAFDWERGQLQGIPGWDWFHFIIQTSILARRHSTERVAAEVEQLIHSERFKKYAAAAGINDIIQPLLLAYFLNHRWVIQPLEGGLATQRLFEFLAARWHLQVEAPAPAPAPLANPGILAGAVNQLKAAAVQTSNLFWEPSLNFSKAPPLWGQLRTGWPMALLAGALFALLFAISFELNPHLLLTPLYLVPCALLTWKLDRRWGLLAALTVAATVSLVQSGQDPDFQPTGVLLWNIAMRFALLGTAVLLLNRIHQGQFLPAANEARHPRSKNLGDHWAVLLACCLWLDGVVLVQLQANASMIFMPLYLLPCVVLTLAAGRRWGALAVVFSAFAGPMVQSLGDADYLPLDVLLWNVLMRLVLFLAIILWLARIQREHVLFFSPETGAACSPARS